MKSNPIKTTIKPPEDPTMAKDGTQDVEMKDAEKVESPEETKKDADVFTMEGL